jgi:hypothetical protein
MPKPTAAAATTAQVTVESNPCWCKPVRLDAASRCTTCGHQWTDCAAADGVTTDSATPTPVESVVLPTTGKTVPAEAAALTIKPTGQMMSRDGVAFTADVKRGKTLIGTIEQDGHGGGTYFHHATYPDREFWERLVADHTAILESLGESTFAVEETLANDLHEEVALTRDLNRKRRLTVRVDAVDPDEFDDKFDILTVNVQITAPAPRLAAVKTKIAADFAGRNPAFWVKGEGWVTV